MGFWCRIKHSNLKCFSHHLSRSPFRINGPFVANRTVCNAPIRNSLDLFLPRRPAEFACNVRFFAAPVQAKPQTEKKDISGIRINETIRANMVRLIVDEGEHQGNYIVTLSAALQRARELKLDLVEVQRSANPPVCKIMDFHREKYKKQIKEKERAKSKANMTVRKGDCKEVKFSAKTELKDLKIKADMVKRMMERGFRVKCMAVPTSKRSEDEESEDLGGLLSQLSNLIEDVSLVESGPWVEKSQAYMIVRHIKFGPSKKGGKKVSKDVKASSLEVQKDHVLPANMSASSSSQTPMFEKDLDSAESGVETEDEVRSDEEDAPAKEMSLDSQEAKEVPWSILDADNDFDQVFSLNNEGKRTEGSQGKETNNVSTASSSPTENGVSDLLHPEPLSDSKSAKTVPAFKSEAPPETENRYARQPCNRFDPPKPRYGNGFNAKDSRSLESKIPYQGKHLQLDSNNLQNRNTKQTGTDSPMFKNMRPPNDNPSHSPTRPGTPTSRLTSYGLFSAQKSNASGTQGIASEDNRIRNPSDSKMHVPKADSANLSSPKSRTDNCVRPSIDRGERGKWGIFSADGSNVIPKRTTDDRAKVQR